MNDYSSYYQAPYRNGSATAYEPDGSTTTNGSNLTDFVTFCQDCHSTSMTASPYSLANTPIDWSTLGTGESGGDKHGKKVATNSMVADLKNPYALTWGAVNGLVLSCADCHEPHGSPSDRLIRGEVNGAAVGNITIGGIEDLQPLCQKCHIQGSFQIHHAMAGLPDAPYSDFVCTNCHTAQGSDALSICSNCHFHGGDDSWLKDNAPANGNLNYTGRRTF
jgi:hypothetical protein